MDDDESDEIEPEVDAPDDAAPAPDDDAPDDPVDDLLTPVTWKCLCMCALLHKEREREGKHQNKGEKVRQECQGAEKFEVHRLRNKPHK